MKQTKDSKKIRDNLFRKKKGIFKFINLKHKEPIGSYFYK